MSEEITGDLILQVLKGPAKYWQEITWEMFQSRKSRTHDLDVFLDRLRDIERDLKEEGKIPSRRLSLARLLQLVNRIGRGLIIYEFCTYEDLLKLCAERQIPVSARVRGKAKKKDSAAVLLPRGIEMISHACNLKRESLIRALERADDNRGLFRFTDLPPEIRQLVYSYSFEYFTQVVDTPRVPPAIAQASRRLRFEALPLFYQQERFEHDFGILGILFWGDRTSRYQGSNPRLESFMAQMPEHAALARNFAFYALFDFGDEQYYRAHWDLNLDIQNRNYRITLQKEVDDEEVAKDTIDGIDTQLRAQLEFMSRRVAKDKSIEMRATDWQAIKRIFDEAHRKVAELRG